jgi:hypothetical protein
VPTSVCSRWRFDGARSRVECENLLEDVLDLILWIRSLLRGTGIRESNADMCVLASWFEDNPGVVDDAMEVAVMLVGKGVTCDGRKGRTEHPCK